MANRRAGFALGLCVGISLAALSCGSSPGSGSTGGSGAPPPCVKGDVTNNEVVMLGDSYMDYGGVGPAIMADAANAKYRHYYLAGSALNYGSGSLNIPYQWETLALTDTSVPNPKDVKVIIMDGGGNDVLIDNQECLTTAPLTSTCTTALDASLARGKKLFQEFASDGVQHLVFYFYPHLDPAGGGGILPTPAPGVDLALDYSLPKIEEECCGASFTSSASNYSCRGELLGVDCIVIDTNPAFAGHTDNTLATSDPSAYYLKSDHVHPDPAGAKVIADLVWNTMVADCIAQ